ncbi:cation/H(+) antiporter 15-like [Hevea brasiliensis]|uniref:cation/H(+) antiporter 15-like n=1 Tax=Hevea brasiliensis TaxID=3981 RepID=UPI0025DA4097|nr:cation/H(+) antiporter 15-like [Hevea brasiliensis]
MGSLVMDPEDIVSLPGNNDGLASNLTTICISMGRVYSPGIFHHADPLAFPLPLLLLQLSLACGTFLLLSTILKPLGLPQFIRQLLGGIILGPTFLCRSPQFSNIFFPMRGLMLMDTLSSFGFILYFFLIGVQMDPCLFKNVGRKAIAIGLFTVAVPMVMSTASSFFIMSHVSIDQNIAGSLPMIAQAESVLAFPIVAQFLAELNIINSEFGRVALSSSFVAGLCSFSVITTTVLMQQSSGDNYAALQTLTNAVFLLVVIVFVMRPIIMWMIKHNPEGKPLKESYVIWLLLAVFVTGFLSQALGLHLYFGPLALGITIPAGPPIGSALVEKLDLLTNWLFMPIYLVQNGLIINIFSIKLKNYMIVQSIALISSFGKFLGTFLVSSCSSIPLRDAASLGLVMNAQGVLELGMFKMMKKNKAIDNEAFVIMAVSMMLVTGAISPIIKHLYDPSRRYAVYRRRTVMNLKPNFELRVLVCIHEHENVPAAIKLLEVLNPTKRSPVCVFLLHLIEIVGQANPLLIPHKLSKRPSKKVKNSEQVINAFRRFEDGNHGLITLYPYTAICPSKTMHDDVCTIALDKRTSLIIVPFHKRFQVSDAANSHKRAIKITNENVIDKAPCSTAILVDRGPQNVQRTSLNVQSSYRVAVLFLGGPDDREALAIGARMTGHHSINLTMVRLLENGSIAGDNATERRPDNEVVSEFRMATAGNYRVIYIEEVVMDGTGTTSVIRSMENCYELVIVGRHHDSRSPLLSGLADWNDHKELGTVGDLLASSPFMDKTTILVVQQHNNATNEDC